MLKRITFLLTALFIYTSFMYPVLAEDNQSLNEKRMVLYKKTEAVTQIPWYYLAAIDQYERNSDETNRDNQLVAISIPDTLWYGLGNIGKIQDENIISLFHGKGKDGNGNGQADPENPEDILYTMSNILLEYGSSQDDIKIALWNFYKRDLTVETIMNTAEIFKKYKQLNLSDRSFPLDTSYNYTIKNNFGDSRGFGGKRTHKGSDIFADNGTPVLSTSYGIVEKKGWNLYGGWRLGVRDINNVYHYYAHMSNYNDSIKIGQIVEPGDLLGRVGSTGYGPPGTSGKFPPHLHYGTYHDNGYNEWAFNPYSYLKKWERIESRQ